MSGREVADMLALAHEGFTVAKKTRDSQLQQHAVRLCAKALSHKDAGAFFGALSLALGEIQEEPFGNDPDVDDPKNAVALPDEDSDAASPAYEGLVDDKNSDDQKTNDEDEPEESRLIKLAANNIMSAMGR